MIPYGFNKNGVAANPKDLSSLIATALSSNLYFNGLMASDYMGIQNKLVYAGEHS